MSLNGIEKSAILLMSIGIDSAVKVLKNFTNLEIRKLLKCMINVNQISSIEVNQVLQECIDFIHPINYFSYVYGDYLCLIVKKILGEQDATVFLEENLRIKDIDSGIKKLNAIDANQLFKLIEHEHIQIITILLVHIKDCQAAQILSFFTDQKRSEIVLRIATFSGIKKFGRMELVKIINNILSRYEKFLNHQISINKAADIISLMKEIDKKLIIDNLSNVDKDLTQKILNKILLFKDLINIKDKYIHYLINKIKLDTICISLRDANELLKNKFIKNMSEKDICYLQKKLSEKYTLSISDITNAQTSILKTMRSLLKTGESIIESKKVK
ncbi:MAG TPA: FliG C-terminal domain-containing protein [Buchnera sp. (in: enterobacteria)]|nr:FliG C-terminal domain-containing protein [Buchnera sp. (in: enterobacteria)]